MADPDVAAQPQLCFNAARLDQSLVMSGADYVALVRPPLDHSRACLRLENEERCGAQARVAPWAKTITSAAVRRVHRGASVVSWIRGADVETGMWIPSPALVIKSCLLYTSDA